MHKTTHEIDTPKQDQVPGKQHQFASSQMPGAKVQLRRRRAQLERRAKRHLRPTAFHEAANAVVARSFGYHVDRITTHPFTDVFDPLTGDIEDRIGHTLVLNLPDEEELHRPEHRLIAERYIIMRLVGPFAEAVSCGRKNRWRNSDDLRAVRSLVETHAEWCQDRYLEWLKARTEMTFFGPAATEIFAVARKLVRQREMTGTEFAQFLRRRTREERKRASELEAYITARDGR